MKGFLHIVEILIVSMLVFLVLMQFTAVPKQEIDWQSMKLSTQANDLLFLLDRKGIDWHNYTQVNASLYPIVSSNTIFSLKIRNSIKPAISVGCICSAAEAAAVGSSLSYFDVNGHGTTFTITQLDSVAFSHDYDVIVVNQTSLDGYDSQVRQFLSADKGIVELRHFTAGEITPIQQSVFNLDWNASAPAPDASPVLFAGNDSSGPYYSIYKYFHSLPVYQENFTYGSAGWVPTEADDWSVSGGSYIGANNTADGIFSMSTYPVVFDGPYTMKSGFMIDDVPPLFHKAQLVLYWQDYSNYVLVNFNADADRVTVYENISGSLTVKNFVDGIALNPGQWYEAKIATQEDKNVRVYIDNSLVLTTTNPIIKTLSGGAGLAVTYGQSRFDNIRMTFQDNHSFSILPLAQDKLIPYDSNRQKIILLQKSTNLPACIVNDNLADNRGRAAWLGYTSTDLSSQEAKSMLRSLVIWAAGDESVIAGNDIRNVPVVTSLYKTYDQDMFQPVEVVLTMGKLYG